MLRNVLKFPINNLSRKITTLSSGVKIVDIINKKDSLELVVEDKTTIHKTLKYNPHWLRFNCTAPSSKTQSTNQRDILVDTVPKDLRIESTEIVDDKLIVNWNAESNQKTTILPMTYLLNNCPTEMDPMGFSERFKPCREVTYFDYQKFFKPNGEKDEEEILKWLEHMADYGLAIVKNCGTQEKMIRKLAEMVAPVQKTIYGEEFDVKVDPNPINIAYADIPLPFHMDLIYYEAPPGLQFLHCIKFDEVIEGGESLLVDGFYVAEKFKKQYPEYFDTLTKIPVTFQKLHVKDNKSEVMIHHRPHINLNHRGEIMSMSWSPANEGPLKNLTEKQLKDYYEAYLTFSKALNDKKDTIQHRLQPGETLCFNNRRILHGRNGFASMNGSRHFQGCYLNTDEFKSEMRSLYVKSQEKKNVDTKKNYMDITNVKLRRITIGNNDFE